MKCAGTPPTTVLGSTSPTTAPAAITAPRPIRAPPTIVVLASIQTSLSKVMRVGFLSHRPSSAVHRGDGAVPELLQGRSRREWAWRGGSAGRSSPGAPRSDFGRCRRRLLEHDAAHVAASRPQSPGAEREEDSEQREPTGEMHAVRDVNHG